MGQGKRVRRFAKLHFVWSNSRFHVMRTGNRLVRSWISLVIAVVFAITAMPGAMAMPAPKPMSPHAMSGLHECCAQLHAAPMKAQKDTGKPSKNMAVCFGMMTCYGMGAIDTAVTAAPMLLQSMPVAIAHQSIAGLTLQPDNPPPIA